MSKKPNNPKILLSYRRKDTSAATGRLCSELRRHYGTECVFMDINSIPIGADFHQVINDFLSETTVVIAVIGPDWAAKRSDGKYRLELANDIVRIELSSALRLGVPIVPLLIDDAKFPVYKIQKVADLRAMSHLNATRLDQGIDFDHHLERLIKGIDGYILNNAKRQRRLFSSNERSASRWMMLWLTAITLIIFELFLISHCSKVICLLFGWPVNNDNYEQPLLVYGLPIPLLLSAVVALLYWKRHSEEWLTLNKLICAVMILLLLVSVSDINHPEIHSLMEHNVLKIILIIFALAHFLIWYFFSSPQKTNTDQ